MSGRPPEGALFTLAALARGVLGPGYRPEVPARMLETLSRIPSEVERKRLLWIFTSLNTRAGALALAGRSVPVSWLSPTAAEEVVQSWRGSRIGLRRQLAIAVSGLALSALYAHPGPEWRRIGYPGPMGPPPRKPKRLVPLEVTEDAELRCDVVVVGSGAGGGCVAAGLAKAGLDVIVLEKGGYLSESDYTHLEGDATRDMYLYGMTLATSDLGCRIISGSTLGGGTVVNYTTSFRAPDYVLEQWASISGIDAFVNGEIAESYDEVSKRVNVNLDSSAAGKRDEILEEGLKKLGWHVDLLPRAVKGCAQDEQCGYCGFGCRVSGKTNTLRTYLEDAAKLGTRIVVNADVRKVLIEDGRAGGVEVDVGGHSLTVKARAVVSAAGAIETPALLLRSGLGGKVGHYLHLHPGTAAFGIFEEEIRVWEGTVQSRFSKEFAHWDGGYGPLFETVPVHPGAGSAALPWTSALEHRELMTDFAKVAFCAVLPRDRTQGRVSLTKDGAPRITYQLTADDERRIAEGVVKAGMVMEAAGARKIYSGHYPPISYDVGSPGGQERWADRTRKAGYAGGKMIFHSFHQMGSCRMGIDPHRSAVGPDNESHEVKDLYVADASTFPDASGVNPMLSIYAIANRAAKKIAARLS